MQCPDADPFDAAFGDGPHGIQVTPPDASSSIAASKALRRATASRSCGRAHVVQQHDVGPGGQHRVELIERVNLDFDHHLRIAALAGELLRPADGVGGRELLARGRTAWAPRAR